MTQTPTTPHSQRLPPEQQVRQDDSLIRSAPSCADAYDPGSLGLNEARQRLLAAIKPLQGAVKRTLRATLGQVLAEDVVSPLNVPAHTNSAMDGYALQGAELPVDAIRSFEVIGTALAGQPFDGDCQPGQCVRIMTGAIMPSGTDTVVMQEHTETDGEGRVRIGTGQRAGQNVRQAGEDIAQGTPVLHSGRRLSAADLGLLASLGSPRCGYGVLRVWRFLHR
ncbi:MAG: hypothetical protein R3E89_19250 [Thiolinea sp.]